MTHSHVDVYLNNMPMTQIRPTYHVAAIIRFHLIKRSVCWALCLLGVFKSDVIKAFSQPVVHVDQCVLPL